MDEIKCILCDVESNHVVIQENGYTAKKCPQCGLIYLSPRPSFDEARNLYVHDDAHFSAKFHISAAFSKRLSARHHLGIIRSFVPGGTLLEIGAGAGYFLDEARRIGFDPFGLELNPTQADFIRNTLRIPCEDAPLSTSVFGGKKFDIVYHCDVLGHLFDPMSDFRTMHALLKEDAFLIFETGNLGEVDPRYFKYFERFQCPDHLFFFGTDNLRALLDRTGFEVLAIYRYSTIPQLAAKKMLARIGGLLARWGRRGEGSEEKVGKAKGVVPEAPLRNSRSKAAVRNGLLYFSYFLRYKIGYLAPKQNRPQTVIIVARKRGPKAL